MRTATPETNGLTNRMTHTSSFKNIVAPLTHSRGRNRRAESVATDDCERASPPGCWLARLLSDVPHSTEGEGLELDEAVNQYGPSARRGGTVPKGFGTARARCRLSGGTPRKLTTRRVARNVSATQLNGLMMNQLRPTSDRCPPASSSRLINDSKDQTGFRMVGRVVTEQMKEVTEMVAERIPLKMKGESVERVEGRHNASRIA